MTHIKCAGHKRYSFCIFLVWNENVTCISTHHRAAFDIRQFHDVILTNGLMPLDMLEELVLQYIAQELEQS